MFVSDGVDLYRVIGKEKTKKKQEVAPKHKQI